MTTPQTNSATAEAEMLRQEIDALKDQLAKLGEASNAIGSNLELGAALQEVIRSA